MTTPAFVPQDSTSLTEVRYYTPYDPYFYSVDNRPLQDLASNITTISSGGGDSARRAVLLTQLGMSELFRSNPLNSSGFITGLSVSVPTSTSVRINPGAVYLQEAVNASVPSTITKQALLLAYVDLSTPLPGTSGQSINYLVQYQASDLSSANMGSSALPFLDSANGFLPCLLMTKELKLSVKAGTAATTGSQTTPSADSGWTPLYIVTTTFGASVPTVTAHSSSVLTSTFSVSALSTSTSMADATNTGLNLVVNIQDPRVNPLKPLKLKVIGASSTNSGAVQLQASYLALGVGTSTSASSTSLTAENLTVPGTANTIAEYTLSGTIPNTAFAGVVSTNWVMNTSKLLITLTRNGAAGGDTSSGSFTVYDVIVSQ